MAEHIRFDWQTVRNHPDQVPLEAAVREVLDDLSGTWQVAVWPTSSAWEIRFERTPALVVSATTRYPLGTAVALRSELASALQRSIA